VRSPAFRRRLGRLIASELRDLGARRWRDVVDDAAVRRRIREWAGDARAREPLLELLFAGGRAADRRLRREKRSVLELLGGDGAGEVQALLDTVLALPFDIEPLVAGLMEQEFVRRMLTDLIFTAIDAFYRRVNPLFGAMTTRILEDQLKGFIGLFMPTLQRQAIAFAASRANQRLAQDLARAVARDLLEQPLAQILELAPAAQRRALETALRRALRSRHLDSAIRRSAAAMWDDLSSGLADKPVAQLVALERLAPRLTKLAVAGLEAALARPGIANFVADEIALAVPPAKPRPS
jgi:hypothetical protein